MTNEDRDEVRQIVQSVLQQEGVAIDDNTVFPMKNSAGQDDALLMMQLDQQHQATEYSRIEAEKVGGGGEPITIDPQPTKDSPNAVSSGGTYNDLLNANARIDSLNIQVGALLTKNMLDVRNNWSGAVGGEVEYSEDIPDTITAFDQLYSPVIRIGYGVPMCYSFYSDEEIGDSVIAFYGTDEPENARDYSDMSRPHTVLQFTRLDNDTYNDNTQKYRYFVVITSPFDGYLVLEHSKNNDNYTVICPMLEAGRTPTEYSADMTAYINAHLTSTQKTLAQRNIGLEKGVAGGVAGLDNNGKIGTQQIPTDVVNGANLGSTSIQFDDTQQLTPTQQVNAQNNIVGKTYNAATFSGLGKKVLAKNVQTVSGVDKNVMTQAFFDATNTVYIIQYDYTLGENITIPAGCTLQFDGGSISGSYTLTYNNTMVLGDYRIYCVVAGNVANDTVDPLMFGAKINSNENSSPAIQAAINVGKPVVFTKGNYTIDEPLVISGNYKEIDFSLSTFTKSTTTTVDYTLDDVQKQSNAVVFFTPSKSPTNGYCKIRNLVITANDSIVGVEMPYSRNVIIDNIRVDNAYCAFLLGGFLCNISNCVASNYRQLSFAVYLYASKFENCFGTSSRTTHGWTFDKATVDLVSCSSDNAQSYAYYLANNSNVTMISCSCEVNSKPLQVTQGSRLTVVGGLLQVYQYDTMHGLSYITATEGSEVRIMGTYLQWADYGNLGEYSSSNQLETTGASKIIIDGKMDYISPLKVFKYSSDKIVYNGVELQKGDNS